MKKVFLFAILLFSTMSFAQSSFGVKVGGQTTGITNAEIGDNQNRFGFYAGGFYNFSINSNFSFQPELLYSYQSFNNVNITYEDYTGFNEFNGDTDPRFDFKFQQHLIKLPLILKYQPNKFYAEIGPELAYLISVKGKYYDRLNKIPSLNGKVESIEHFQASLAIGGGYKLNDKLEAGLRFSWGLTEFSEYTYIKNFNVGVGISYRLK